MAHAPRCHRLRTFHVLLQRQLECIVSHLPRHISWSLFGVVVAARYQMSLMVGVAVDILAKGGGLWNPHAGRLRFTVSKLTKPLISGQNIPST